MVSSYPPGVFNAQLIMYFYNQGSTVQTELEVVTEAILPRQVTYLNNTLNVFVMIVSVEKELMSLLSCLTSTNFLVYGTPLAML